MKKNILKGTSLVLLASMALVACKKETDFTVVNATAWVGEPVVIKDNSEKYKKNTAVFYDFGDQSSTNVGDENRISQINPSHIYNKAGVYTITQQVMKSRNIEKRSGKTIVGSQTVTIQMVTPTMELSVASPNTDQMVWVKNTTDESTNLGYTPSYQLVIQGPNGTNDWWNNDTRSFAWTPSTAGTYKVTLYAYQGNSKSMVSADVTVTGFDAQDLKNMLNGKWSVATTASLTGASYGTGCAAATLVNRYSSISVNGDGNIYSAVEANQGGSNSTAVAGNVVTGIGSISVTDAGYVNVGPDFFVNNSTTAFQQYGNESGIYVVKSATATAITLERVDKGDSFCNAAADTFTDTYTITLTR